MIVKKAILKMKGFEVSVNSLITKLPLPKFSNSDKHLELHILLVSRTDSDKFDLINGYNKYPYL